MSEGKFPSLIGAALTLESTARIGELVAKWWLEKLAARPSVTLASTMLLCIAVTIAAYFLPDSERKAPQVPPNYAEQISALDATQASLDRLSRFIREQRVQVVADQRVLNELHEQRKTLEPLVSADRRTVNALLRVQEERTEELASRERWLGFGLGVVSSIVASALLALAGLLLKKWALRRSRKPQAD